MEKQGNQFVPMHVIQKNYKYSTFDNGIEEEKFFLNAFLNNRENLKGKTVKGWNSLTDLSRTYKHNSFGYRSPEFAKNVDTIFAGCSYTYGLGLPEEARWTELLSNKMNSSFVNLGIPGASVSTIVSEVMHYCKVYGNPKNIFCLFPELTRMMFYLNQNIVVSKHRPGRQESLIDLQVLGESDLEDRPRFAKKPYVIEDIMPTENAYLYSLKAIQMLEQFCEAAGINLYWSLIFDLDHLMIEKLLKNPYGYYKYFVDTEPYRWYGNEVDMFYELELMNRTERILCHEEFRKDFEDCFDRGTDIEHGVEFSHYGMHRHIHLAEDLFKAVVQRGSK